VKRWSNRAGRRSPAGPRPRDGHSRSRRFWPPGRVPAAPGSVTSLPPAPRAAADLDEEWPEDTGPAEDRPGPIGMELIERQLGGTVTEEIEEP
jgi:hypothetical protein